MALQNRATLKSFFQQGMRPTAGNFADLIDSMFNKLEDTAVGDENGLTATGLTPFFSKTAAAAKEQPGLFAIFENTPADGLVVKQAQSKTTIFSATPEKKQDGSVSSTSFEFMVNGTMSAVSRKGNYSDPAVDPAKVLADGKWHKIITGLDGLNLFEVVASASGPKGKGEYAVLHALALSAYGQSKNRISDHEARYNGLFRKMDLRWTGTTNNYNLEVRTTSNLGAGITIKYNIIKLICE